MTRQARLNAFLATTKGNLIVSCQALEDEPLHGASIMARMAVAAQEGGAVAIRANSPQDIRAIKAEVPLPIIGIYKEGDNGVFITPTFEHAKQIAEAGADIIALDATQRPRPDNVPLAELIQRIHEELDLPIFADVSTLEEAEYAQSCGVDIIAPTLAGYTPYTTATEGPDFALIQTLVSTLHTPIIAEGRIQTPQDARHALDLGVHSVVVGSAITRPQIITRWFAQALHSSST